MPPQVGCDHEEKKTWSEEDEFIYLYIFKEKVVKVFINNLEFLLQARLLVGSCILSSEFVHCKGLVQCVAMETALPLKRTKTPSP